MTDWRALHGDFFTDVGVLVTGGAGFIGSHLVEALVELGARVAVIDDLSGGDWKNIAAFDSKVEKFEATVLNATILQKAMSGCSYVFHQAAIGSVPRSIEQPERYYKNNVDGTVVTLEVARAAGVRRLLFASSSSVYGNSPGDTAKNEHLPLMPLSPYAATKSAGEQALSAWHASYGIDTVSLRYFNVFGPRQNANSAYAAVIAAFAKAMSGGEPATIFGNGNQTRDFTFVDNVVHANLLAARSDKALAGRVFNAAYGGRVSINQLHLQMAALFGSSESTPSYETARAGEVIHSRSDCSLAKRTFGYQPIVSFDDGLAQTVLWYKHQFGTA